MEQKHERDKKPSKTVEAIKRALKIFLVFFTLFSSDFDDGFNVCFEALTRSSRYTAKLLITITFFSRDYTDLMENKQGIKNF